jgi:hypothetical protein
VWKVDMFKNKIAWIFSLILLSFLAGCAKQEIKKETKNDFESLMGKDLPSWQYIQTKEDLENLNFFKALFDQNCIRSLKSDEQNIKIPKILHFIWIGPNPFPRESVENVRTWVAKHPGWKVKFWTDRKRPVPCPGMELNLFQDFKFQTLADCYQKADNFGEKSDVWRYEILYREGGVYVDHDVKCFKAFDQLNLSYDFYCGMDMPYKSSLPSCVFPTNNLIGVRPEHPVLKSCIDLLNEKWDQITQDYPGSDRDAMLNRVLHRTFLLFGEAIKSAHGQQGNRDIVFPAYYFDAPSDELAIWARHLYSGKWFEDETKFEKMVRERLMMITKKTNKLFLIIGITSGINLMGFIALFFLYKKRAYSQKINP